VVPFGGESAGLTPRAHGGTGTDRSPSEDALLQRAADELAGAYIQFKAGVFTAEGKVTESPTDECLRSSISNFRAFIDRVYAVLRAARRMVDGRRAGRAWCGQERCDTTARRVFTSNGGSS
jgi:hypothetical protein